MAPSVSSAILTYYTYVHIVALMNIQPRVIIPMPQSLLDAIEDYRFTNRLASRSETIRQLILLGLEASVSPEQLAAARGKEPVHD